MGARYSARSTERASQYRLSAVRESIRFRLRRLSSRRAPRAARRRPGMTNCKIRSSVQHPGVLRPAALAGIDHERTLLQCDPGEPAGHDADAIPAGQHEWAQIDVTRRNAFLDAGGAGGERERRLCDEVSWVGFELG